MGDRTYGKEDKIHGPREHSRKDTGTEETLFLRSGKTGGELAGRWLAVCLACPRTRIERQ